MHRGQTNPIQGTGKGLLIGPQSEWSSIIFRLNNKSATRHFQREWRVAKISSRCPANEWLTSWNRKPAVSGLRGRLVRDSDWKLKQTNIRYQFCLPLIPFKIVPDQWITRPRVNYFNLRCRSLICATAVCKSLICSTACLILLRVCGVMLRSFAMRFSCLIISLLLSIMRFTRAF